MMTLWWPINWIWVTGNINEHISNNIHTCKYIKGFMGQWYPHYFKWEENIVVILHIYGARTILLLFYDDFMMTKILNTSIWKYKNHVSINIHTYKYIKVSMRQWYLYSTKWEKILW